MLGVKEEQALSMIAVSMWKVMNNTSPRCGYHPRYMAQMDKRGSGNTTDLIGVQSLNRHLAESSGSVTNIRRTFPKSKERNTILNYMVLMLTIPLEEIM